ncbi:50S ribosomal protein L7/L12 [bacterium]|nr:50S ribosomal protein L7/L12 [bacterium]
MIRTTEPAAYKVKAANELSEIIEKSSSVLLADFTGMSVASFDKLRLECFNNDILFRVAKNTIAKLAFEWNGHKGLDDILTGPTGFCIGFDDPILPIRILSDFIKEASKPEIKGCLVEGKLYGPEKVKELRDIPPRDVLLSLVVGAIAGPLSAFVNVINEIPRTFVSVVDAIARKAEEDSTGRDGITASGGSVEQIIEAIGKMTVLELVELKKALEEKFDVSAAAPVAMAGPISGAGVEAAAEVEEQTEFTVILTAVGDKKIQVIKEVRAITSLGLKEAKALVDEHPKPIKEDISKEEAMAIKAKIEEAGGQVEIK